MIDEGLLPHHPPILVTIDKVSQGEITHYSSDKVHYLGHERWIEHLGHFCSVNSLSTRSDHEGYQCVCGCILCIDRKPRGRD